MSSFNVYARTVDILPDSSDSVQLTAGGVDLSELLSNFSVEEVIDSMDFERVHGYITEKMNEDLDD